MEYHFAFNGSLKEETELVKERFGVSPITDDPNKYGLLPLGDEEYIHVFAGGEIHLFSEKLKRMDEEARLERLRRETPSPKF
jgi:hypothetical protein